MTALTDNALCVCLPDNCQLDCSPISKPPHVPRAPRTRIHVARTRLLTTSTTPSRGTQPQHNAGLHAQQLAKPTRSHAQHHAATTTTTTTTKLQRPHPRDHHPSRNNADATSTRLRATRQKHPSNTRQRSQSSKAPQRTNCVQTDVRRNRPTHAANTRRRVVAVPVVVPPRADPTTPNPSRQSSN
jgi:hypothetical protein